MPSHRRRWSAATCSIMSTTSSLTISSDTTGARHWSTWLLEIVSANLWGSDRYTGHSTWRRVCWQRVAVMWWWTKQLLLTSLEDSLLSEGLLLLLWRNWEIVCCNVDVVVLRYAHVTVGCLRAFTLIEFIVFRNIVVDMVIWRGWAPLNYTGSLIIGSEVTSGIINLNLTVCQVSVILAMASEVLIKIIVFANTGEVDSVMIVLLMVII